LILKMDSIQYMTHFLRYFKSKCDIDMLVMLNMIPKMYSKICRISWNVFVFFFTLMEIFHIIQKFKKEVSDNNKKFYSFVKKLKMVKKLCVMYLVMFFDEILVKFLRSHLGNSLERCEKTITLQFYNDMNIFVNGFIIQTCFLEDLEKDFGMIPNIDISDSKESYKDGQKFKTFFISQLKAYFPCISPSGSEKHLYLKSRHELCMFLLFLLSCDLQSDCSSSRTLE